MFKIILFTAVLTTSLSGFAKVEIKTSQLPAIVGETAVSVFQNKCKALHAVPTRAFYSTAALNNQVELNVYTVYFSSFAVEVTTKDNYFTSGESVLYVSHSPRCL